MLGVVRDENVVEDGSGLHLPQVESDAADFLPVVQFRVGLVVGVVNLGVNPGSLQTKTFSQTVCFKNKIYCEIIGG